MERERDDKNRRIGQGGGVTVELVAAGDARHDRPWRDRELALVHVLWQALSASGRGGVLGRAARQVGHVVDGRAGVQSGRRRRRWGG